MAQAGTTPIGQAPQNSNDQTQNNQNANGDPANGGAPQLIGGKYKNMDEFVTSVDRGYQTLAEGMNRMAGMMEQAMQPTPHPQQNHGYSGVPVGSNYGADGYARGPQNEDQIDPQQFLLNPGAILAQRDARLTKAISEQVGIAVKEVVGNAMAVSDFKSRNADLTPHEPLVRTFLQQVDQRKPVAERLADAAVLTRNYLAKLGGRGANPPPNGDTYVESPSGQPVNNGNQNFGSNNNNQQPINEEQELADYIAERSADFAAKFGINMGTEPPKK